MSIVMELASAPRQRSLEDVLTGLYDEQLRTRPHDLYLKEHAAPRGVAGQAAVCRWYRQFLPEGGAVLDWGCRHAPDSCLLRARLGRRFELHGCDFVDADQYRVFHDFADLNYTRIDEVVRLPYADASMDVVIGSGTLEHAALHHESLKELYRILKVGGRLIITYLPNGWSYKEAYRRVIRRAEFHRRLYRPRELRSMLLHTGFLPMDWGYQTPLDRLRGFTSMSSLLAWSGWTAQLHRITSCLCAVAQKMDCM